MEFYLSALIPTDGLLGAYPLEDIGELSEGASLSGGVADYSTNGRDLLPLSIPPDCPTVDLDAINDFPVIDFTGSTAVIGALGSAFSLKHAFVMAKYTGAANFGTEYRGLVSDENAQTILVGDNASNTKFFNNAFGGGYTYRKSQVSYAESNQQAPFTNLELLEASHTTGWSMDGLQIGQQRTFTARRWIGKVGDMFFYSSVKSGYELQRIYLYYDLKFGLWALNNTTLNFPAQQITGIYYARYDAQPLDWDSVTASHTYEDEGKSFNQYADTPARRWEIGFTGLSESERDVFDAFYNQAKNHKTFNLLDKDGTDWSNVRIERYRRTHDDHKSWMYNVSFILAKYP